MEITRVHVVNSGLSLVLWIENMHLNEECYHYFAWSSVWNVCMVLDSKLDTYMYLRNHPKFYKVISSFRFFLFSSYPGGRYKNWKRRWFILTDNCLYYFEYTTVSKYNYQWNLPAEGYLRVVLKGGGREQKLNKTGTSRKKKNGQPEIINFGLLWQVIPTTNIWNLETYGQFHTAV